MGLLLAAQVGEEIHFVGRRVAVVEIHIHALAYARAALPGVLADQAANGGASRTGAKAMQEAHTDAGGVGFRGGKALVVLELPRQAGQWNVIQQRGGLGHDPVRRDHVIGERGLGDRVVDGYGRAFLGGKAG